MIGSERQPRLAQGRSHQHWRAALFINIYKVYMSINDLVELRTEVRLKDVSGSPPEGGWEWKSEVVKAAGGASWSCLKEMWLCGNQRTA